MNRSKLRRLGPYMAVVLVAAGLVAYFQHQHAGDRSTAEQGLSLATKISCAAAEQTANASRVRQVGANGVKEGTKHWRIRLLAQRQTLYVALEAGTCPRAPGFPPFNAQATRAIRGINRILLSTGGIPGETGNRADGPEASTGATTPRPTASVSTPQGGDASAAPTGSSQPGRHDGGSESTGVDGGGDGVKKSPGRSTPPSKVPTEHGGSEGVPPPPPSSSSESSSGASTSTTERSAEVVHEAAPPPSSPAPEPAAAPVREGVGTVVEGVGHVVEETGGTVNETVHGVTCAVGLVC